MPRILVVEDEPDLSDMICSMLADDYQIDASYTSKGAWDKMASDLPDLVLLDWMLPDSSGLELLRRMRKQAHTKEIPVIMLTARDAEQDRVHGLDSGADDYLVKPFSFKELGARIRTQLRRGPSKTQNESLEHGGLKIDTGSHRVSANNTALQLGPTEYRLLHHFMSHPEQVYSRTQLLDTVWGMNVYIEERTVDVHIRRLRKALEPFGLDNYIQTVRSAGYRFSITNV